MDPTLLAQELDTAISGEQEAQAFYAAAAQSTDDPSGAAMFRQMAELEGHHRTHLLALRESLARGGGWPAYVERPLPGKVTACAIGSGASSENSCAHADAITALRTALSAEERSEAHYRKLAQAVADQEGRAFFTRLADEEAMHRRLLDDQIYNLANQGVWVWGD